MQSSQLSQERATEGNQNDYQSISVEFLQERQAEEAIVEIQDGHQSDSVPDDSDIKWIKDVTKRLEEYEKKKLSHWSWQAIPKVREDIRKCDMNAYDPSVVAIGPYHHDTYKKRITLQAMQDHKWDCMWRLVSRRTKSSRKAATDLLSTCLMEMKCIVADVRDCYSEDLGGMTTHELALIMLLDGCFIIHVLLNSEGVMLGKNNDNEDSQEEEDDIAAGHEDGQDEEDGIAAGHEDGQEKEDDIAAGHEDCQEEKEDVAAGHKDDQEKKEDIAAKHERGQEKKEDIAVGHKHSKEKEDDIAAGHKDDQEKKKDIAAKHERGQEKKEDIAVGHKHGKEKEDDIVAGHKDDQKKKEDIAAKHERGQEKKEDIAVGHKHGKEKEDDIAAGHEDGQEVEDIAAELENVMETLLVLVKGIEIDFRVTQRKKVWHTILLDLVKVENQIPFTVIKKLFKNLQAPGDEDIDLVKIADKLLRPLHPSRSKSSTTTLLEQSGSKSSTTTLPEDVHHLLHLFHSTLVPSKECLDNNEENLNKHKMDLEIEWIPSVTKLQLAGVEFVEKKVSDVSFLDISFKNGTIEIPKVNLDGTTISLFRNLIAYEQCNNRFTKDYVTAYASFMDYMINTSKDVELFESKGIFINQLGTPDQAATLINQLCHHTQDRGNNYLQGSMRGIKNYHDSKLHKWWAGFKHDYFKNPWTIASLLAAFILLLLTVEQSFFAAYSYFRPPS